MSAIRKGGVLLSGVAMFALAGGTAMAQNTSDRRFAKEAASGSVAEVQMGQLAVAKGASEQVKQFGERMIDDHMKVDNELKDVASQNDIRLSKRLTAHDRLVYDNLSRLSGPAFDQAYMEEMVKDHQADVDAFQTEAHNGSNADLKSFATTTLPTLEEHLRIARETNDALGATGSH